MDAHRTGRSATIGAGKESLAPCLRRRRSGGDARLRRIGQLHCGGPADRKRRRPGRGRVDLAISQSATLGLSYTGQLAEDAQEHAFKGVLAVRF